MTSSPPWMTWAVRIVAVECGVDQPASIALIESDDLIRQLASRWLAAMGYAVHCTTAQQLEAAQPIVLIVANIDHPRQAGAMVRLLRAAHGAPILLVSARFHRMEDASSELAAQLGVAAVLAKPYSEDQLRGAVAAALAHSGDRAP